MKDSDLERRFLDFVFTTEAPITVGAVAYHAGCSLGEAEAYLDQLAGAGRLRIENDDDGNLFYVYPDRGKTSAAAAAEGATRACPLCGETIRQVAKKCRHCGEYLTPELRSGQRALVRAVDLRPTEVRPVLNPGTAAVLSLLFPGAGQIYAGRLGAGIGWMFAVALSYPLFIVPGLILHFFCVASAARAARDANERRAR
jgi:TM2 domain-containing membrane protein YozV